MIRYTIPQLGGGAVLAAPTAAPKPKSKPIDPKVLASLMLRMPRTTTFHRIIPQQDTIAPLPPAPTHPDSPPAPPVTDPKVDSPPPPPPTDEDPKVDEPEPEEELPELTPDNASQPPPPPPPPSGGGGAAYDPGTTPPGETFTLTPAIELPSVTTTAAPEKSGPSTNTILIGAGVVLLAYLALKK
jgi:hypothetical protein